MKCEELISFRTATLGF